MDSDVSVEGDGDKESPQNRSSVISNSQPSSPDPNSDNENSSDGLSSPTGSPILSPVLKVPSPHSSPFPEDENSYRDSSPDIQEAKSARDSSPDRNDVYSDNESSQDSKTYEGQMSTGNPADSESSPDLKHNSDSERNSSPESQECATEIGETEFSPCNDTADSDHGSRVQQSPDNSRGSFAEPNKEEFHCASSPDLNNENPYDRYENVNGDIGSKKANSVISDVRSDIASLDSVSPNQFENNEEKSEFTCEEISDKKKAIMDFADDLSDVSDIESNDSFEAQEQSKEIAEEEEKEVIEEAIEPDRTNGVVSKDKQEDAVSIHAVDGEEQLDFEAEEGECSPRLEKKVIIEEEEVKEEKSQSDLEEGELTDDNDTKPEETERPVCRFFSRGHCTWGSNCRFIHPGVMDKGNYSMFETVRPIITPGAPPPPSPAVPVAFPGFPPHVVPPHIAERAGILPPGIVRKEEPPSESSWERGLRQAKELIRNSSKRKETEIDFEDKKMNLTLSQDEIDKENDYYSRHSGSPPLKSPELSDKWKLEPDSKSHRDGYPGDIATSHTADVPPLGYYPSAHLPRPDYWNAHRMAGLPYEDYALRAPPMPYGPDYYSAAAGRRYMHPNSYYPPRPGMAPPSTHHAEFYDRKQKHKPYPGSSREVIVQKNDKAYKEERYRGRREESPRLERGKDDEWADPWMRSKSPPTARRRRHHKNTYSSGSSYSSSSDSSRSSSRSSVSSRSRNSRSRSKSGSHSSSRSVSMLQANKKPPMQFKLSPTSRQQLSSSKRSMMMDRRMMSERPGYVNQVPVSPTMKMRAHSPGFAGIPGMLPKSKGISHLKNMPPTGRTARSLSHSSKSSSGSSSSDSSSESTDSSGSSSSSSKSKSPPVRVQKRNMVNDHMNISGAMKVKAMDAMKVAGQKQQIKLTLKGSNSNSAQSKRLSSDNSDLRKGKKRVAESSESGSDSDTPAKKLGKLNSKRGSVGTGSSGSNRREELLKQLKAVEDAIARKRSKNL